MRQGKFVIYKGRGRRPWRARWFARNRNEQVWKTSQGYGTWQSCLNAVRSLKYGGLQSVIRDEKGNPIS